MCGRTACTLAPENIQKACGTYDPGSKKYRELEWRNVPNGGRCYKPSTNICPTDVTPVIVENGNKRMLMPMMWGMIPPWHKRTENNHKLSTNNCRIENILESKLYKEPMVKGKRCVVVCDGFYEWQTTKTKDKQPYFIFAPQTDGVSVDDVESWPLTWSPTDGWAGPRLLQMAALYNIWISPQGDEVWSYSIVTMESDNIFNWLHHRIPAILDTDELITTWLSQGKLEPRGILAQLTPNKVLRWHPVSPRVNNSRDKSNGLNRAIDITKPEVKKPSKSASLMESWLRGTKRKLNNVTDAEEKFEKVVRN